MRSVRPGLWRGRSILGVVLAIGALPGVAATEPAMQINVARPTTTLNGPWRFHTGDDPRWAAPEFDDSYWESVDLTPAPGAHDADVGLTRYVPGWRARGHADYSGFAWYRTRITFAAPTDLRISMLAPAYVEDAYQVFWNGTLIGASGDFSGATPIVYSSKPQIFLPPPAPQGPLDAVIAIRVWMSPGSEREADAGGIHIAPVLGERDAIDARYRMQWQETILGYIVDVVEPLAFMLLAVLAWCFARVERDRTFSEWLGVALLLTAALRANQAFYFWTSFESLPAFLIAKYAVLEPLGLAAWAMTWRSWARLERPGWLVPVIAIITVLTIVLALIGDPTTPARLVLRALMAAILLAIALMSVRRRQADRYVALAALLLVMTGQFAEELWSIGIPGIWFPFGIGVSRTQFAYAALIMLLATLLIRRIQRVASVGRS